MRHLLANPVWVLILLLNGSLPAQPSATQPPASRPVDTESTHENAKLDEKRAELDEKRAELDEKRAEQLAGWYDDLADPDPAVRDEARYQLMGMDRRELESFAVIVKEAGRALPGQKILLREIVTHVYLAGEPYETEEVKQGFLGVRWPPEGMAMVEQGLPIGLRLPGFCANRALQDGDIVVRVVEHPELEIRTPAELSMAVRSFRPGDTVQLDIIRRGREQRVKLVLDARPLLPVQELVVEEVFQQRERKATQFLEKFESWIKPGD